MSAFRTIRVTTGVFWVEIPEADLRIQCGCPADAVKHLMRRGLISETENAGVTYETGPNAILLSEVMVQNGEFANLGEFSVLQMLYRQGMILPDHPNNNGAKPLLIGTREQIEAQLAYIHRGNYGLVSEEELMAAGCSATEAAEQMRMKLWFAFGEIRAPEALLETCVIDSGPIPVRSGVTVRRCGLNQFEFAFKGESISVDLNLLPSESYEPPYSLGFHQVERSYFSVIHSGEGDGWDINRPCMGSVISYQGRLYLIDAGPNLRATLTALGIGINEIVGLFHTHSHDDHFSGLTTLMRSGRRMRYYATPTVRAAVTKKLCTLLGVDEKRFGSYFDVVDLPSGEWSDIDGLEVKPVFSPHPVETNVLFFRSLWEDGYRTYAHCADIASFRVLADMTNDDTAKPGISTALHDQVTADYLAPANIKKIDIGGGLIHGVAEDFQDDWSGKILLGHIARPLTADEKVIGSAAHFGTIDKIIPSSRDYSRRDAFAFMQSYFPDLAQHSLQILLNNDVETFNPETSLVREGDYITDIFLILTGSIEMAARDGRTYLLSAGAMLGELAALKSVPANVTYRAIGYVRALRIPVPLYREFVRRHKLLDSITALGEIREFFKGTWLLGEEIPCPTNHRIAKSATVVEVPAGDLKLEETDDFPFSLFILRDGKIERRYGDDCIEILGAGDFFGGSAAFFGEPDMAHFRATADSRLYKISVTTISDIPAVRWKLFETHQIRQKMLAILTQG